ncbi:flagellar filament capping protein FliD [Halarsenatibacter silvermanii]|uniref:Flagellar hook-associated protein 2 n=1 Tax=Halarsenatibacter silvermanii TaxID=321763 RepID=A0A1G9M152_9FIRM|nr:flagellar filament capping protein FliD [Halarsenatibacter silvermanii]SDL67936.1 flagellar hook-associated protein 2 [Halarsenatibacter silvermanii]
MVQGIALTGMASGIDTDEITEQLIQIERSSIRRLELQKENAQNEKKVWQSINQVMNEFDNSISSLRRTTTFTSRTARSNDENIITATASRNATRGSYRVEVDQLAQSHRVAGENLHELNLDIELDEGEELNIHTELGLEGTFELNDMEFTVEENMSLDDIRTLINAESEEADIEAEIMNETLILNHAEMGAENEISFTDTDNILQDLGVMEENNGELDFQQELRQSQDSIFFVDGLRVEKSINEGIEDVIENVTLNLQEVSEESVTITVENDSERTLDAVRSFVESYNELIDNLREEMGEGDMLQGDTTIRRLNSGIRRMLTNTVFLDSEEYDFRNLADIGIEIDADGLASGFTGEMRLDEDVLTDAIDTDPEGVQALFTAREDDEGVQGVAERVSDSIQSYIQYGGILDSRERSLESRVNRLDRRIDSEERRVERREGQIRSNFGRMEVALNQMQAQRSWLSGQIQQLNSIRNYRD